MEPGFYLLGGLPKKIQPPGGLPPKKDSTPRGGFLPKKIQPPGGLPKIQPPSYKCSKVFYPNCCVLLYAQ
jgi:hypothetical protein